MYMEGKNLGPNPGSNSVQLCEVEKITDHLYSSDHVILKAVWNSIIPNKYRKIARENPTSSTLCCSSELVHNLTRRTMSAKAPLIPWVEDAWEPTTISR